MAAALGLAAAVRADDAKPAGDTTGTLPPDAAKTGVTYATDIKPIFDASCVKCHDGADTTKKPKAGLALNTLDGALKGSKNGKVIIPGDSAKSPLVHNIGWLGDHDDWMPPPHNKAGIERLTNDEVGLIRAWIDQGAK